MKLLGGGVRFSKVWTKEKESLRYCLCCKSMGRSWWCSHLEVCSNNEPLYEQIGL